MQRRALMAAVREVLATVEASGVAPALEMPERDTTAVPGAGALHAFRAYTLAASAWSPPAHAVAEIFGIDRLASPEFWVQALQPGSPPAAAMARSLAVLRSEGPKVLALLAQGAPDPGAAAVGADPSAATLTVRLFETDGQCSTVIRLIDALAACQEIYDAQAVLHHRVRLPLAVTGMDAGGDKSFDLVGAPALVHELRGFIQSVWALVGLHPDGKPGQALEGGVSALPALEQVRALEAAGRIVHEQAQAVCRGLVDGSRKLVAAGLVIDPGTPQPAADERRRAAPEPRFLTSHRARPAGGAPSLNRAALSDDELDRLAARLVSRVVHLAPDGPPS